MKYTPQYDLSDKNVLIIDTSSAVELAILLAPRFKNTHYFCPWTKWGYPDALAYYIGTGIKNVDRAYYVWELVDAKKKDGTPYLDLVVFVDVYDWDIQKHIEQLGIPCYGCGWGAVLELDRIKFKKILKNAGLPVGKYDEVKGLDDLREYLKKHEDIWYKVSLLRGLFESEHSKNYKLIEPKLDDLQNELSILKDEIDFCCENTIDSENCVEIANDMWTVDGKYPNMCGGGFEVKNTIYLSVCKPHDDFPKQLTELNYKLSPVLNRLQYKGPFGTEVRVLDDGKGYCNDFTARFSFPNTFLQMWHWLNYVDVAWGTAHGEVVDAIPRAKYGIEYIFKTEWASNHYEPVYVDPSVREQVKLLNLMQQKDMLYVVPLLPGGSQIGSCVACGDTIEEAVKNVKKVAEKVEGTGISFEVDALDKELPEKLKKLDNLGINFF